MLRSSRLSLTASLKANGLSTNLALMETSVRVLTSRARTQVALQRYNMGNNTAENWVDAATDLGNVMSSTSAYGLLTQLILFPMDANEGGSLGGVLNVTSSTSAGLPLPWNYDNGSTILLGDSGLGYPPNLYPNLTYSTTVVNETYNAPLAAYDGQTLGPDDTLLLGPWQINATFALTSITVPVINNTSANAIIGWMTVVLNSRLILEVLNSPVGLDDTGITLLVGPTTQNNRFPGVLVGQEPPFNSTVDFIEQTDVQFVFPPVEIYRPTRHSLRAGSNFSAPFNVSSFEAVLAAFNDDSGEINNAGSQVSTRNEQNNKVAVGYAVPSTDLAAWVLLVEQGHSEAYAPISHLRKVLLACVFGTAGVMILLVLPIAHYASLPIRRLRQATRESVDPPGYDPAENPGNALSSSALVVDSHEKDSRDMSSSEIPSSTSSTAGFLSRWMGRGKRQKSIPQFAEKNPRHFRIPRKVQDGKHVVYDELTDLTLTFNEMADELTTQYSQLEERVRSRTTELELSKKAAEAANESKTLFIANISHELKTPLNGILGMCAVAMQEDDSNRIKQSLSIIYKSGDLLHNLLTDLLTFSKNEVGQHITLDEKGFCMTDIETQLRAIFNKQAQEGKIKYSVLYEGPLDSSGSITPVNMRGNVPDGLGHVKDMFLWGDYHRILQVIINLVSNSLKFTPNGGSVTLTIRCTGKVAEAPVSRKNSSTSLQSRSSTMRGNSLSRSVSMGIDDMRLAKLKTASAKVMAPKIRRNFSQTTMNAEASAPPPNAPSLGFEFEVEDTGPGIPPHLQQSIFLPFVQGDLRLTKRFGGTGLGLSICAQLAKLMHGTIDLASEEGIGSKFTFRVPLTYIKAVKADNLIGNADLSTYEGVASRRSSVQATGALANIADETEHKDEPVINNTSTNHFDADQKPRLVGLSQPFFSTENGPMASPSGEKPSKNGKKIKVLVAEDNKVNQEVMLRMLRLEKVFDVHVAKDGQEAYDMVKQSMAQDEKYDVIFMDVQVSRTCHLLLDSVFC